MKVLVQIKKLSIATIIIGFISGILFIAYPDQCIKYASLAVGAAFIAAAIVGIISYLIDRSSYLTLGMGIVLGIVGIIICFRYQQVISFIIVMIGIFVLIAGITNLFAAIKTLAVSRIFGWTTFLLSVVTIVFGAIAVTRSTELSETLIRLIGIGLIVYAIVDLIALIEVKLLVKRVQKTVEENEINQADAIEVEGTSID